MDRPAIVPGTLTHLFSAEPMPDDRRTARRAILPGVRATFEGATGQQQHADVPNLGRGGIFLQTDSPVPVGKRLSLEIHVIGQPGPWSALGRVAWARWLAGEEGPAGMGVKLIDVDDAVSEAIDALVDRLSPAEPPPFVPDAPPSRPRVPGAGTLPPTSLLVAPLVYGGRMVVAEQGAVTLADLAEPNVAIDLVTKKTEGSSLLEEEPGALEDWEGTFFKPKRRIGRWIVVGLLLVGAIAAGYACRARLLEEWSRLRASTTPALTPDASSSSSDRRA